MWVKGEEKHKRTWSYVSENSLYKLILSVRINEEEKWYKVDVGLLAEPLYIFVLFFSFPPLVSF